MRNRIGTGAKGPVTHPGRVILRQEFVQHVWAEAQVSKNVGTTLRDSF